MTASKPIKPALKNSGAYGHYKAKMNAELDHIRARIKLLVPKLPDQIDRSWLVSTYLSLVKAESLNYQDDSFSKLSKDHQDKLLTEIKSLDSRKKGNKDWEGGYYFNNAMFRMVALAEIALQVLFERKMKMKPPPKSYHWLVGWFEASYKARLNNIGKARTRVNKFKHEPRQRRTRKKFETMKEAVDALKELLSLLEQI